MYEFIVNPNSRSENGRLVWKSVEQELNRLQIEYHVHFTRFRRHATKITAEITCDCEEHTIVVLGGDGTINEVVNGIRFLSKTTLGYIPTGSGNDFARSLSLPADPVLALHNILEAKKVIPIDIGITDYGRKRVRFAVSSGLGYDAAICHQICISKVKVALNKLKLGKLAYVSVSLNRLYYYKPQKMTILLDDEKTLDFNYTYFATAMNLPYEGGGCKFCPNANPSDGYFDLIVIADVPKLSALTILPAVFSGRHTHMKGVHIYRCKKAEITMERAVPLHTDGEPVFLQQHLTYQMEAEQLHILA